MNLLLSKPEELNKIIEKAYNLIIENKSNSKWCFKLYFSFELILIFMFYLI